MRCQFSPETKAFCDSVAPVETATMGKQTATVSTGSNGGSLKYIFINYVRHIRLCCATKLLERSQKDRPNAYRLLQNFSNYTCISFHLIAEIHFIIKGDNPSKFHADKTDGRKHFLKQLPSYLHLANLMLQIILCIN